MRKVVLLIGIIITMSAFDVANETQVTNIPNNAYTAGEELEYLLYYGIMDGGKAKISIQELPTQGGEKMMHAKVEATTIGVTRMFIAIDDVYESFFSESNCKPVKAVRNISENRYKFYNEVLFNHETNQVNSQKSGVVDVPKNIYDIISSLYYMRRVAFKNIKVGDTISIMTYFADEVFPYNIVFKGKEVINTKSGKYNALRFQPVVETGRVFKEEDDMQFWVSDDDNFLPLRVEFEMLVGSIKCDLVKHKGVRNPLNVAK